MRGRLSEIVPLLEGDRLRGEFTLVVEGAEPKSADAVDIKEVERFLAGRLDAGAGVRDAAREAAEAFGLKRSDCYRMAQQIKDGC